MSMTVSPFASAVCKSPTVVTKVGVPVMLKDLRSGGAGTQGTGGAGAGEGAGAGAGARRKRLIRRKKRAAKTARRKRV